MAQTEPQTAPIAIVGMSCRLPGNVSSPEDLWDLLVSGENTWSPVPAERYNEAFFYDKDNGKRGRIASKGGHFIDQDHRLFDAQFFGITAAEAVAMDPQQRVNLECAYEALENAGMPLSSIAGKDVGVFVGSVYPDYDTYLSLDPISSPRYQSTGNHLTMQSNKISYTFDLRGPSFSVDTACSSGLTAVHLAIQSLRNKECSAAIVGGSHLNIIPFDSMSLSKMGLLSSEGRSFAFDDRASGGFGRGEGVAFLIFKPLDLALKDGDNIRAVIRQSGLGQDGKTPGITYPNGEAQASLIRAIYQEAGIDPKDTPYVEAHGTGTAIGDPIEAKALYDSFCVDRGRKPLYIGSLKSNIGHLENVSGVASLIKSVLMLERGMIAPNADFQTANRKIPLKEWNMKVPKSLIPWPSKTNKRISISNYGFGGSNAHMIVEHRDILAPGLPDDVCTEEDLKAMKRPLIYTLSAHRPESVQEQGTRLIDWLRKNPDLYTTVRFGPVLARTLNTRRSRFKYRGAVVASSPNELANKLREVQPNLFDSASRVAFVFTGQGASWPTMGREFLIHKTFKDSMTCSDATLRKLGAEWSLLDEIARDESSSNVMIAAVSQSACTAIQIALVDTLRAWGVSPSAVTGHSSGEIAAAYCAELLSAEQCLAIAYYRGKVVGMPFEDVPQKGAMAAIGDSASNVARLILDTTGDITSVVIGCINSPESVTISGDEPEVERVVKAAEQRGLQARKVRVDVAYHSPHMAGQCSETYLKMLGRINLKQGNGVHLYSSVEAQLLNEPNAVDENYWIRNMVSPVRFSESFLELLKSEVITSSAPVRAIVEIGPHSLMKTPIRQCMATLDSGARLPEYLPSMIRNEDSVQFISTIAKLWTLGFNVDLEMAHGGVLETAKWKSNLPTYPWNRTESAKFWHSARLPRELMQQPYPRDPLLGIRALESSDAQPSWRNIIRTDEILWLKDHKFRNEILFPFAGYLFMALQALRQIACAKENTILGFWSRDVKVSEALVIRELEDVEIITSLCNETALSDSKSEESYVFHVSSVDSAGHWTTHCQGTIGIALVEGQEPFKSDLPSFGQSQWQRKPDPTSAISVPELYEKVASIGTDYGHTFALMSEVSLIDANSAHGTINVHQGASEDDNNTLSPRILDAISHPFFAIMSYGRKALDKTLIPVSYQKAFVPLRMLNEPLEILKCVATVENHSSEPMLSYRTREYPVQDNVPDLLVQGLQFAIYGNDPGNELTAPLAITYRPQWQPLLSTLLPYNYARLFAAERVDDSAFRLQLARQIDASQIYVKRAFHMAQSNGISEEIVGHLERYRRGPVPAAQKSNVTTNRSVIGHTNTETKHAELISESETLKTAKEDCIFGELVHEVGTHLDDILLGSMDALSNTERSGLLRRFYETFAPLNLANEALANLVDCMMTEDPCLSILDISGVGSGNATQQVLQAISKTPRQGKQLDKYDYTTASPEELDRSKVKLSQWGDLVNYRVLDLEQNPVTQGFSMGEYDLVVASNVLLVSGSDAQTNLAFVRRLLKPNGRLAFVEPVHPDPTLASIPLVFGANLGRQSPRKLTNGETTNKGPMEGELSDGVHTNGEMMQNGYKYTLRYGRSILNEQQWDQALKTAGFSGVDGAIPDFPNKSQHQFNAMTSTAVTTDKKASSPPWSSAVIVQSDPSMSENLAEELSTELATVHNLKVQKKLITELQNIDEDALYTFIDFQPGSILMGLSPDMFEVVKRMMNAKTVLWVTKNAVSSCPGAQQVAGFTRSIRNERNDMKLFYLNVEDASPQDIRTAMRQVYDIMADPASPVVDPEFQLDDMGILNIWREVPYPFLDRFISRDTGRKIIQSQPLFQQDRPLTLRLGGNKKLDGGYFDDSEVFNEALPPFDVDVAVEAVGLNFKDVLLALGQVREGSPGAECSGVITQIGQGVTGLKVGDRVCGMAKDCFSTHVRARATSFVQIPDKLSFVEAASLPISFCTAYYALIDVGRLSSSDTLLVHAAAGGLGQAAIMIAKRIGARVFCTVSNREKRGLLVSEFGVAESDIFYSRSTSFRDSVLAATGGRGVDVVLNSLAGGQLKATWECIAPFGRFLEVGKRDILANSTLRMKQFERNVSFSAIDLTPFPEDRPHHLQKMLKEIVSMIAETGPVGPVRPIQTYPYSEIAQALRAIGGGKTSGKLVMIPGKSEMVLANVPASKEKIFRRDATYLVTGGNGGVGRTLCRWLAQGGAAHVVAISRSAVRTEKIKLLEEEMRELGAQLHMAKCDISDSGEVAKFFCDLRERGLPLVRGLFHCAMVLQDIIFDRMTFDDWAAATKPKVDGAWNFHNHLQHRQMDFFIMLSSTAYRVGNRTQAAYSAAGGFLEGLAHHRRGLGLKADAIELGLVEDEGVFAQNKEKLKHLLLTMVQICVDSDQIIALCKAAILNQLHPAALIGARVQPPELKTFYWMHNPHFVHIKAKVANQIGDVTGDNTPDEKLSVSLGKAGSKEEKASLIRAAVISRFAVLLMVPRAEIPTDKSFFDLGIDSLVAVEVRTWVWQEIGVRVVSRDILGAPSVDAFVAQIVESLAASGTSS